MFSGWLLAHGPVPGQADDVSPFSLSVVLLVGNAQIPVEAELGELTPAEVPQWGGLLRGEPERLAAAMRSGQDARLCWPDGQVRLGEERLVDDQGRLIVTYLGEGLPPAG